MKSTAQNFKISLKNQGAWITIAKYFIAKKICAKTFECSCEYCEPGYCEEIRRRFMRAVFFDRGFLGVLPMHLYAQNLLTRDQAVALTCSRSRADIIKAAAPQLFWLGFICAVFLFAFLG